VRVLALAKPEQLRPLLEHDDFTISSLYQDPEVQYRFWSIVGQALTGPLEILIEELTGIRYIGAIREIPPKLTVHPKNAG
jgi:hypothetical protein